MDISKLSVTELKAIAYDLLATLEQAQKNLKVVNQAIVESKTPVDLTAPTEAPEPMEETVETKPE